jgi:protocatechuate 3,4-dioxygenase beta subunit
VSRRIALLFLLLVLPCCFALGEGAPSERRNAGGYRISGVAVNSRDGGPIPFCRIQVESSPDGVVVPEPEVRRPRPRRGMRTGEPFAVAGSNAGAANGAIEVQADAHGRFQVELPHSGWWSLSGSSRGFRRQNYDMHEDFFSSIVLTPAGPAMEVTLRLQPDAAISGVVRDEAGEPVRDVQVAVEQVTAAPKGTSAGPARVQAHQVGFAQTDDRGMYEVAGLAPGAYRVRVQGQPWYAQGSRGRGPRTGGNASGSLDPSLDVVYPMQWFPGVEMEEQAEVIRLTGAEDRQADFHLQPIPAAHVHFTLPERLQEQVLASPRQPAGIMISRVSASDGLSQNMFGSAEGDFGGLAPGTYEVRTPGTDGKASAEVRRIQIGPGSVGGIDLSGATLLTKVKVLTQGVADDAVGDVIFTDVASGRTVNVTQGALRAMGRGAGGPGFAGVRGGAAGTDDDRSVFVAPGRYAVSLGSSGQSFVTGLKATGAQVSGLIVQVDGGSPVVTLQVASGKSQVAGVARMGGLPAAGAMVLLVPANSGELGELAVTQRDQTNTDGSFAIRGVIPGRYILLAIDHGWDVNWHDPATLAMYLAHGVPLEIAPSSKVVREIEAQKP